MSKAPPCEIHFTPDGECFLVFDGKRIAQRQLTQSGKQNGTWLSLEPGYEVIDDADLTMIEVRYNAVRVH